MTQKEIDKILTDVRGYDPVLRYWIFRDYIKDANDLEFLMADIQCQMDKRSMEDE